MVIKLIVQIIIITSLIFPEFSLGKSALCQQLFNELPKEAITFGLGWKDWSWVSKADYETHAAIFKIYTKTYENLGHVLTSPEGVGERHAMVFKDSDGNIRAFLIGRMNENGFMITQIGSDGTRQGIAVLIHAFKQEVPDGVYFQVSGSPLSALVKQAHLRLIPLKVAQRIKLKQERDFWIPTEAELQDAVDKGILPNDEQVLKNAYFTRVQMNGKVQDLLKVMIGRPRNSD